MFRLTALPLRQKFLIGLSVFGGVALIICASLDLMNREALNMLILSYSIAIPLFLLMSDAVIDLNNKPIFTLWLIIAIILFGVSLLTYDNRVFLIRRWEHQSFLNTLIASYSTSSLKTLMIFLAVYWLINRKLQAKGLFIINTFKQSRWYHDFAHRKIFWSDVGINVLLAAVIILAAVLGH